MNRQSGTVRIARWSATHPWRAIAAWVVFVAVCVAVGGAVQTNKATPVDYGVGESGRALQLLDEAGLTAPAEESVLISARSGALDSAQASAAAGEVAAAMRALPEVEAVGEPVPAPDGSLLLVPVTMRGDALSAVDRVEPLLAATAAVQADHPGLRVEQVGAASIESGVWTLVGEDIAKSSQISLPVTLVILLVAFGAIVAAGVPVLLGLSAVAAAIGLSALASHVVPDIGSTANMIALMGMAVGVDYSLFYLKREREERARGLGTVDAIEVAAATSGRSVVVSGLAVIVAMSGLYVAGYVVFSSLATGAVIVVAVAVLGSLTVLPALLVKLGRAVDRPRVPLLWRLTNRPGTPRVWPVLLRPALRHPVITLVVAVAALGALALPALDMKLQNSSAESMPRSMPVMQAYDRMTAAFPSERSQHQVVVRAPAERAGEVSSSLGELLATARGEALFGGAQPGRVRASADGTVHAVSLDTPFPYTSAQAEQAVGELRSRLLPQTVGPVAGASFWVTGEVADNLDSTANLERRLPLVIGFVLLLTFAMMAVTFRSVVVALTAVAINLLSTLAAFGLLTLVFQGTWAQGLLDFTATGAIVSWIPAFLFAVLFGLSMDYHVFVVSRIREAARRGLPTRDAVEAGIVRSAGVVTSAATVMIAVFAIFGVLRMVEMKQMGVGLAVAILLDAFVIRVVVLPAIMTLLGRANWWPSKLSRRPARPEPRPTLAELVH
ncbi:MAG TPA: MMPL family transporter [Pseudonocardiaceae bacterium]|nr:MMPL family transporter [Pseudonocardiaceae bacterium]